MANALLLVEDMKRVTEFYRDVLGLKPILNPKGVSTDDWIEFDTGTCRLTLHPVKFEKGKIPGNSVKLRFFTEDVKSERAKLEARGVRMSEITTWGEMERCEGKDPEDHVFQISNCKY